MCHTYQPTFVVQWFIASTLCICTRATISGGLAASVPLVPFFRCDIHLRRVQSTSQQQGKKGQRRILSWYTSKKALLEKGDGNKNISTEKTKRTCFKLLLFWILFFCCVRTTPSDIEAGTFGFRAITSVCFCHFFKALKKSPQKWWRFGGFNPSEKWWRVDPSNWIISPRSGPSDAFV